MNYKGDGHQPRTRSSAENSPKDIPAAKLLGRHRLSNWTSFSSWIGRTGATKFPLCSTAVPSLFTLENLFLLNQIFARQSSS